MNRDKYYESLIRRVEVLESKINNRKFRIYEASVDGATKLYEDQKWTVYRITTPSAAKAIGKRASWSFTAPRSDSRIFGDVIRNYNLDGGVYFYIAKNNPRQQYCVLQTKDGKIKAIWDVKGDSIDYLDADLPVVPEVNLNGITDDDRLIKAVMNNDVTAAKEALSAGADPNALLRSGHPLICAAAADLNYPMVRLLLKAGADPNAHNRVNGGTAINAVVNSMKKWNPNKVTPEKNNIIRELLQYGAEVDRDTLKSLCRDGYVEMVKLILNNSNIEIGGDLLWAASAYQTKGNIELVEFLLKAGADPNEKNLYGETLLQRALKWDQRQPLVAKYVSLLKQYGAVAIERSR